MPRASSVSGRADAPGRRWPAFRDARARILGGRCVRGWVWWLSMLWVVIGASGVGYVFVCTVQGCTTNQCTNDEFWFPLYNGEPGVIAAVGALAAGAWLLLAVPLLVAGFVRLRGWRPRSWLRAAAWAGAWVTGFALIGLAAFSAWAWANGSGAPSVAWGELPILALWLALGAVMTQIQAAPAHGSGLPGTTSA
jgi:hypothetical protein